MLALAFAPALVVAAAGVLALLGYAAAVAVGTEVPRDEPTPARLRATVVALHLLQPLARARGSLEARPLPPLPSPDWSGDRLRWVDALHVALAGQRCVVRRGGTSDGWDLRGSAGPLLRCTLTTGVRWGRTPVLRRTVRPRPAAAAPAAARPAARPPVARRRTRSSPPSLVAAAAVELRLLTRRVTRAVAVTGAS